MIIMNLRRIALLIPYNKKSGILFQDRRGIIKPVKKDYGFFGGGIEEGETIEQALTREIKEELSIDVEKVKKISDVNMTEINNLYFKNYGKVYVNVTENKELAESLRNKVESLFRIK